MRLALIGYGAIGQLIVARLKEEDALDLLDGILVRSRPETDPGVPVWYEAREMIAVEPDIVIEAAGHEALRAIGRGGRIGRGFGRRRGGRARGRRLQRKNSTRRRATAPG